ncbi:histone-lysine N-methyltransferase eggless [Drosophila tropicalis]|uniref:histone-lysine N-methyltransferase eggless n=1 Tax=Drosophila tropicalis TaxID=46794 RepID=UPI0035AC160D
MDSGETTEKPPSELLVTATDEVDAEKPGEATIPKSDVVVVGEEKDKGEETTGDANIDDAEIMDLTAEELTTEKPTENELTTEVEASPTQKDEDKDDSNNSELPPSPADKAIEGVQTDHEMCQELDIKVKDSETDNSIEVISSPIPNETQITTVSSVDVDVELEEPSKAGEDNLDSSIELIESPKTVPVEELVNEETHQAEDKPKETESDSSIEVIVSPEKSEALKQQDTMDDSKNNSDLELLEESTPAQEIEKQKDHTEEAESLVEENKSTGETVSETQKTDEKIDSDLAIEATPMEVDEEVEINKESSAEDKNPQEDVKMSSIEEEIIAEKPTAIPNETKDDAMEVEATAAEYTATDEASPKKEKEFEAKLEETQTKSEVVQQPEDKSICDGDIFYNKDCLNCYCQHQHKQFILASAAVVNYFRVPRKANRRQYICLGCHDTAIEMYEEYAGHLMAKQPLLLKEFKQEHTEFVALDSSDEDDNEVAPAEGEFSCNDLRLIESELEDAIQSVFDKVDIKQQITWSKKILTEKYAQLENKFNVVGTELGRLQKSADQMHFALYNSSQVVQQHKPPLDLYQNFSDYVQVPPPGEIERPPIQLNETYYAVKNKAIASWVSIKVIEFVESTTVGGNTVQSFKIKYLNTPYQMVKTVTAKHIAYFEPPPVRLPIGTRVIAYFDGSTLIRGRERKERGVVQSAFYPGIIAEPMKQANRFRYLIFYDDGYTQYVLHKDVRLVCQASEKVWEDVHPNSRDFIQKYVEKYSVDRPMVQCTRGQSMNTESNGTWLYARVIDIDCSLVLMQFEGDKNHTEWIYRGSLRLGPVFKETQNSLNSLQNQTRVPRRTEPFIRYTKEMESSSRQVNQQMRAIARKSSSAPQQVAATSSSAARTNTGASTVKHLNNSTIYVDDENRPKGHVVYFTAKRNLPPKIYKHHECTPNCLFKIVHRLDSYSPLAKPLLSGWERLVLRQKVKRSVVYRGPCGKSFRNLAEVHQYLRATDNVLNVDNFDFTPDLRCLAEYSIDPTIVKEADISKGQEKMAIPLVNYYDNTLPPPCTYAKQRIPTEGVHLNLDEEFLVGCDCEDDCSDKSKCSCWQLTVAGVKYCNSTKPIEEIGYQYKRLHEHVPTGIYECNSRCKCKMNCLNRVVQHSLEMKLQVFKTSNRGWGLRCVNDIPKGAFICIYAGHLLTETKANEGGQDAGDEYFADLDYIEVAEQLKEGFESDVEHSEHDMDDDNMGRDGEDGDDDFRPHNHYQPSKRDTRLRVSRSNSTQNNELDSQERAVINFNPNADLDETVRENSVRRLFGKDEAPYIMDAKTTGNLGRYFNHSCNPNLFVQNVFVDTHDLRFPWVAFFSASHIRSGTELTWNYNYEVGVVPGKVLYCQCGAANCRIRLL